MLTREIPGDLLLERRAVLGVLATGLAIVWAAPSAIVAGKPDVPFPHLRTQEIATDLKVGYAVLLVDLNGDGFHELIRGIPGQNGDVLDQRGQVVGSIGGGTVAMLSKFMPHAGEQILAHYPDSKIRIWADRNAHDSSVALKRYADPFYAANQRLTAVGINMANLGGL